jgi:DNA repair protein RecO (recombination protein O)
VSNRVQLQPAYVLHRYDYSESSVIVEAFSRDFGRVALIAKGVKKPSSNFRPVLLPLQPLALSWGGDAEVRTLKAAEWQGGAVMPTGALLWAGLYANELLLKLCARDDAHPRLFDAYAATVQVLAQHQEDAVELALRAFELVLLRDIGLLPNLEQQTQQNRLQSCEMLLKLTPEAGLQAINQLRTDVDEPGLAASTWNGLELALAAVIDSPSGQPRSSAFASLMRACQRSGPALKPQLRQLLHYHCATPMLKTRQVLFEIKNLA